MATIPAHENEFPSLLLVEAAAPATPGTGLIIAYAKAGGVFAWKDDAGVEHIVGEGDTAAHLADTTDAHDASAVSFDPTGLSEITGTEVQTALEELDAAIGSVSAGAVPFKRTVAIGTGDISFSSTSKAAIDATDLAYLTLTLAVSDVVRCTFSGQLFTSSTQGVGIDFEVDQPTSGNVFVANSAEFGLASFGNAANRRIFTVVGMFTATEAGVHGFRPAALVVSGSVTFCNAASGQSDTALTFSIENLGQPAA